MPFEIARMKFTKGEAANPDMIGTTGLWPNANFARNAKTSSSAFLQATIGTVAHESTGRLPQGQQGPVEDLPETS
jgi:hypothetical protein